MDITGISPAGSTRAEPAPQNSASDALSSDFDTFLRMLTTQLENQDPLNPVESADFAVQLATFSGVEQQIRTNELLQAMAGGAGASGLSQIAGWVGMEVRVAAPAGFSGAPITLAPEPDLGSDTAILVVRDQGGNVVSREALPPRAASVEWAGVGARGAPLPPGLYSFEVESISQGNVTSVKPVAHYATVTEARIGATGAELVLSGGASVAASDVLALRLPAGAP